ncbi:porin, partial [Cupriavidus sp. 8B]
MQGLLLRSGRASGRGAAPNHRQDKSNEETFLKTIHTALALAIGAACAGHANAQSNVTLYGLIDTTISTISNANAKGDR